MLLSNGGIAQMRFGDKVIEMKKMVTTHVSGRLGLGHACEGARATQQ